VNAFELLLGHLTERLEHFFVSSILQKKIFVAVLPHHFQGQIHRPHHSKTNNMSWNLQTITTEDSKLLPDPADMQIYLLWQL
jgi:hypothetical protein